ncbi:hypothetical protein F5B21DRAFT_304233 [Xylaria acuta]|nr:hypothetical protein F5B21DRAFT_304233 [Xylaria acuta]
MAGETGSILKELTPPIASVIGGLFAIAMYNSFEIYISIFRTFRRRQGLYFWSAICANTGIPLNSLFVLLRHFSVVPAGPVAIIMGISWWLMVDGQSLMLYSRLHLVIGDPKQLRWLLSMIVGSFVLIQIPTTALFAFISFRYHPTNRTVSAFGAIEIAQLVTLSLQECILSGYYVHTSRKTLKPMEIIKGTRVRKVLRELIGLFVLVVALDISLIIVQFANYFYIQAIYKPVVYSIKLKVETFVLNNLVVLIIHPNCTCQQTGLQSYSQALNMRPNGSRNGSWRPRYTSSAGVSDRCRVSSFAGGGSVSTAWTDESGRV